METGKSRESAADKRTHERFVVRKASSRHAPDGSLPYRVVNVSRSGCALKSRTPLAGQGGSVCVDLPLPSKTQSLSLEATVVWEARLEPEAAGTWFLYGVRFGRMDHLSHLILEAYLGFLRRDAHIARLEEAWEKLRDVQQRIEVMIACEERKEISYLH